MCNCGLREGSPVYSLRGGRPEFPEAQQVASSVLAKSPRCKTMNSRSFLLMLMPLHGGEDVTWHLQPPLEGRR